MKECKRCGFNNEYGYCECPHSDKWYACPIEAKKPENGEGSMEMTVHGTDRITPKIIESAVEITKQNLNACGIQIDTLAPMGWFKYDGEDEE